MARRYEIRGIGRPGIWTMPEDGKPREIFKGPKGCSVLLYLRLANEPVPRDNLLRLIWPALDGSAARGNLRQILYRLRNEVLDLGIVPKEPTDPLTVDRRRLECDVEAIEKAAEQGAVDRIFTLLERGSILGDRMFSMSPGLEDWAEQRRLDTVSCVLGALRESADRALRNGRSPHAMRCLNVAVDLRPADLKLRLRLAEVCIGAGDRAQAARHLARLRPEDCTSAERDHLESLEALLQQTGRPPHRKVVNPDQASASSQTDSREETSTGRSDAPEDTISSRLRHSSIIVGTGVVGVLLVLGFLARFSTLFGSRPSIGGGDLLVLREDSVVLLTAEGTWADPRWRTTRFGGFAPAGQGILSPRTTADGRLHWFRRVTSMSGPPYVTRILENGSERDLIRTEGDDHVGDLAPDGSAILLRTENLRTARYDLQAFIADTLGGNRRLLYRGREKIGLPRWSTDGRRIALSVRGQTDSLLILTPSGKRVETFVGIGTAAVDWCGPGSRYLLTGTPVDQLGARVSIVRVDVDRGEVIPVEAPPLVGGPLVCSPDGSAAVYHTLVDGRRHTVLVDITGGAWHALPARWASGAFAWVPDEPVPVPSGFAVAPRRMEIGWGGSFALVARELLTNGEERPAAPVEWTSHDSAVATVSAKGIVHGNGPGQTWITGTLYDRLRDSVRITVVVDEAPELLFADRFRHLDPASWIVVGEPPPTVGTLDGDSALILGGDGRYRDGLRTRRAFLLDRGATVELEYALRLTERSRQKLTLCLEGTKGEGRSPSADRIHRVCFAHPAEELARFDGSEVALSHPGFAVSRRVPELLPSSDWVHLALVMRPDGRVRAVLNGRSILEIPLPAAESLPSRWRVWIGRKSANTILAVRNLRVWDHPRSVQDLTHPTQPR